MQILENISIETKDFLFVAILETIWAIIPTAKRKPAQFGFREEAEKKEKIWQRLEHSEIIQYLATVVTILEFYAQYI